MVIKNEKTGIDVTQDVCDVFAETRSSINDLVSLIQKYEPIIAEYTPTFVLMETTVTNSDITTSGSINDCYHDLLYYINSFIDVMQRYKHDIETNRVCCKELIMV